MIRERGRRLTSGGVTVLMAALLLFLVPGGTVSAAPVPTAGTSSHGASMNSTGVVPYVEGLDYSSAGAAVQAAGFVVQFTPGWVDCGPPFVQVQTPAGGTVALLGSTVVLKVNRQPAAGQPCP